MTAMRRRHLADARVDPIQARRATPVVPSTRPHEDDVLAHLRISLIPLFSAPVGTVSLRRRRGRQWHRRSWTLVLPRWAVVFEVGALVAIAITIVMLLARVLMPR